MIGYFLKTYLNCRLKYIHQLNLSSYFRRQFHINMSLSLINKRAVGPNSRLVNDPSMLVSSGTIYLQFIGSGAKGAPKSVYLFTECTKYMFNCGEGTQRLAHEHKIKISRLEHVFLTYPKWENIGGLPGLALSMQDGGARELTIHGPFGSDNIFNCFNRFVSLDKMTIVRAMCTKDSIFDDHNLTVKYIPILNSTGANNNGSSNCTVSSTHISDDNDFSKLPPAITVSMAFVCILKPKPGALNLEACVERSVPAGPLLGKLKSGIDVTLKDGTVIKSSDVKFPDSAGEVIIFVECPSMDFLDSFVEEEAFKKHQTDAPDKSMIASTVVHFTSSNITNNEKYKEWMDRFPSSTLHVYCNDSNTCTGSEHIIENQIKLNVLEPNIFPLLKDDSIKEINDIGSLVDEDFSSVNAVHDGDEGRRRSSEYLMKAPPPHVGYTLRQINFRPEFLKTDVRLPLGFNRNKALYDLMNMNGFPEQLAVLRDNINQIEKEERNKKNVQNLFPKILFLGTGSSVPSKHRNVTGILINLTPTEHILLDCGEGTYSQLFRFYGSEESDKVLTRIKMIFISHIHPDHHMGLIALLKARRQAFSNLGLKSYKLFLLGPRHVFQYLGHYNQRFEPVFDEFTFIPNNSFDYVSPDKTIIRESDIFSSMGLKNILTTPVKHCPFAYGISFIDKNGWKLTYSGDTMPCDSLVDIGKLSDVLIHEATMEDDLKRDAQIKMHSTVSEAIEIGRKMCAKFTLLTHFSQRYCKVPRLNTDLAPNTGISFDMMIVSMADLKKLPLLIPALRVMFADQEEIHKARAFKRKMREEQDEDIVRIVEQFAVEDMNSR